MRAKSTRRGRIGGRVSPGSHGYRRFARRLPTLAAGCDHPDRGVGPTGDRCRRRSAGLRRFGCPYRNCRAAQHSGGDVAQRQRHHPRNPSAIGRCSRHLLPGVGKYRGGRSRSRGVRRNGDRRNDDTLLASPTDRPPHIQIDIDPESLGRNYPPDVAIQADALRPGPDGRIGGRQQNGGPQGLGRPCK